jgi:ferrous iron transport protein B
VALKKTVFRRGASNFVLELPVYRLPRFRNTARYLWEKLKGFLLKVTTIVAAATIVIWFLQNFNFACEMLEPAAAAQSMLGQIGASIGGVFAPLGFAQGPEGWKLIVAILTGLIAKELVVATMGVLYTPAAASAADGEGSLIAALGTLAVFSPLSAMTFMIFNLLSIPCFAAVATAYTELKSIKWTAFTLLFWLAVAWTVSFLVYQVGSLFMNMNAANAGVLLFAAAVIAGSVAYAARRRTRRRSRCGGCTACDDCGYNR